MSTAEQCRWCPPPRVATAVVTDEHGRTKALCKQHLDDMFDNLCDRHPDTEPVKLELLETITFTIASRP